MDTNWYNKNKTKWYVCCMYVKLAVYVFAFLCNWLCISCIGCLKYIYIDSSLWRHFVGWLVFKWVLILRQWHFSYKQNTIRILILYNKDQCRFFLYEHPRTCEYSLGCYSYGESVTTFIYLNWIIAKIYGESVSTTLNWII